MAKKPNMQAALMGQSAEAAAPLPAPPVAAAQAPAGPTGAPRVPSRVGKKQIGAWLNPDFDRSLLLIMAKAHPRTDKQTLIAEALNDLFRKYNVPVVRD